MNKTILFGAGLLVVLAGTGWYFLAGTEQNTIPQAATQAQKETARSTSTPQQTDINASNTEPVGEAQPGFKLYRNDEYGFEFQYPDDWDFRIPEFYSAVSLFNMGVKPAENGGISPIVINITPKEWVENALVKMKARGVITKDVTLSGYSAIEIEDTDRVSQPAILTLVLIDNEYWIDITGIEKYESEYRELLRSFVISK